MDLGLKIKVDRTLQKMCVLFTGHCTVTPHYHKSVSSAKNRPNCWNIWLVMWLWNVVAVFVSYHCTIWDIVDVNTLYTLTVIKQSLLFVFLLNHKSAQTCRTNKNIPPVRGYVCIKIKTLLLLKDFVGKTTSCISSERWSRFAKRKMNGEIAIDQNPNPFFYSWVEQCPFLKARVLKTVQTRVCGF